MDSAKKHTAGLLAHHLSGGQVCYCNKGLSDELFGLIELCNAGKDLAIFTGAVIISKVPQTVRKPAMALPYHLYMLLTQGTSSENAYGTAFVMMMIVLVTNSIATWFAWRNKK